jgi:hypothetical protein
VAATWAMPLPMVPAPHTAMVWIVIGAKVSVVQVQCDDVKMWRCDDLLMGSLAIRF